MWVSTQQLAYSCLFSFIFRPSVCKIKDDKVTDSFASSSPCDVKDRSLLSGT